MQEILTDPKIIDYLVKVDGRLKRVFDTVDPESLKLSEKSPYCILLGAVIGQKIKFSEARKLRGKIYTRMGGTHFEASDTLQISDDEWFDIGLDRRQLEIMRSLEKWCVSNHDIWSSFRNQSATCEETLKKLEKEISGIGAWTIAVVKLSMLYDLDIFPLNDVFLKERMRRLYGQNISEEDMAKISETWSPYRSIVCWWMWRWF